MSYEKDIERAVDLYDSGHDAEGRQAVMWAVVRHPVKFWRNLGDRGSDTPLDRVLDAFESGGR